MVEQGFVALIQNALDITPVIAAASNNNFDFGGTPDLSITFTATSTGTWGNNIQVNILAQLQVGGSSFSGYEGVPSTSFSITTGGNDGQTVWVYVATDSSGNGSTTVGDLISALNSNTDVNWFMTTTTTVTDLTTLIPLPNPYAGVNMGDSTSASGFSSGMSANLAGGANAVTGYVLPGGFPVMLPKDLISASNPQAWTYMGITRTPLYVLEGEDSLTNWTVRLDCHGFTMMAAIVLAQAIDDLLSGGWRGTLPESGTVVVGMFKEPLQVDGFSDSNRSYVRSLEYSIHYYNS